MGRNIAYFGKHAWAFSIQKKMCNPRLFQNSMAFWRFFQK